MKNAINYYYNIVPDVIHQTGKIYRFTTKDASYILTPFNESNEINDIYELSISLLKIGVPCHQIILNTSNQVLTNINEISYVLMRIFIDVNKTITFNDVIDFNYNINNEKSKLIRSDWFNLWTKKIDYFEYQVNQLGKKYPLIRESFSYFIGLAENAISLVKNNSVQTSLVVAHRRIKANDSFYELYNPLNLIIDSKVRNITEYFKSAFLGNNIEDEINHYLYYANLSNSETLLFFARMVFPTFYFDMYEKIINEDTKEEELNLIIEKINDYEILISNLYNYFRSTMMFPDIEWLKKRTS